MTDQVEGAIEDVYRRRYGAFVNAVASVTGDVESARDAVQDAFAQAFRRRETFRGEGSVESWLWRIVLRTALERRRNGRELTLEEAFVHTLVEDERIDPDLGAAPVSVTAKNLAGHTISTGAVPNFSKQLQTAKSHSASGV